MLLQETSLYSLVHSFSFPFPPFLFPCSFPPLSPSPSQHFLSSSGSRVWEEGVVINHKEDAHQNLTSLTLWCQISNLYSFEEIHPHCYQSVASALSMKATQNTCTLMWNPAWTTQGCPLTSHLKYTTFSPSPQHSTVLSNYTHSLWPVQCLQFSQPTPARIIENSLSSQNQSYCVIIAFYLHKLLMKTFYISVP